MEELILARQKLDIQFNENLQVKKEFDNLKDDDQCVFKLINNCLLPQSTQESKMNVQKRLDFIDNEIQKVEQKLKDESLKQSQQQ